MGNTFQGFPVSRARFAEVAGQAAEASLPFSKLYYHTFFDSLDGLKVTLVGAGTADVTGTDLELEIDAALNDSVTVRKSLWETYFSLSWNKNRTFRTKIYFESSDDSTIQAWVGTGFVDTGTGIGFAFYGGKLYARTKIWNGGTTDVEIEDLGTSGYEFNETVDIVFTAGVDCKFYIDGVLKATITTNLPTGSGNSGNLVFLKITNPAATESGLLTIAEAEVVQDP